MGQRLGPQIPKADKSHYEFIQGGMPEVTKENGLTVIHHKYERGENMRVTSHNPVEHYQTVVLSTPDGPREFDTALLRRFHGEPCEGQSTRLGGEKYERRV